jgi:hypothetical protein
MPLKKEIDISADNRELDSLMKFGLPTCQNTTFTDTLVLKLKSMKKKRMMKLMMLNPMMKKNKTKVNLNLMRKMKILTAKKHQKIHQTSRLKMTLSSKMLITRRKNQKMMNKMIAKMKRKTKKKTMMRSKKEKLKKKQLSQ